MATVCKRGAHRWSQQETNELPGLIWQQGEETLETPETPETLETSEIAETPETPETPETHFK